MRRTFRIAGMGLYGLLVNWGRTILTMLGIVIGVAAVVMLASLGNGIQKSISGQINDLGPNLITVSPGTSGEQDGGTTARSAPPQQAPSSRTTRD